MRKILTTVTGIIVLVIILFWQGSERGFFLSPEDKINAAFPVSDAVHLAEAAAMRLEPTGNAESTQMGSFSAMLKSRMKLRAITCSNGYLPSWYSSPESVRGEMQNKACFAEADNEIAAWIGIYRVGKMLAQPALKPIPETPPPFIISDESIQKARFSDKAGIALIETNKSIQVVDIEAMEIFWQEPRSVSSGPLSPNGRLFTTMGNDSVKIKDTESGAVITELTAVRSPQFYWLNESAALYVSRDTGKPFLIDFISGKDIPLRVINENVMRVAPVPGNKNQYVIFTYRTITKIELVRDKSGLEAKLIDEKTLEANSGSWSEYASDLTADGSYFFGADQRRQIILVSLKLLGVETIPLDPFYIQAASAMPDPDKIMITGSVQPSQGEKPQTFIYSISNHTMALVQETETSLQRYFYIPSLKKQATINGSKIVMLGDIKAQEATPVESFVSERAAIVSQRKIAEFERQQAILDEMAKNQGRSGVRASGSSYAASQGAYASSAPAAQAAPMAPITSSGGNFRSAAPQRLLTAPPGILTNLARDAKIEAVGVYEGGIGVINLNNQNGNRLGGVQVRVRRSAKPLLIVLSSYEPVNWKLAPDPGANIVAVLVSGYYPSQVTGAGSARVVMAGSNSRFAYKTEGDEYKQLNMQTISLTGKPIGAFQGEYTGISFNIGGN